MRSQLVRAGVVFLGFVLGGLAGFGVAFVAAMCFMLVTRGPDDTVASWAEAFWEQAYFLLAYVAPVVLVAAGGFGGAIVAWRRTAQALIRSQSV
jgi:hypothetical protein